MPGVTRRFERGPITYPAGEAITGGQLVVPGTAGTAGTVVVAGADAADVLGVATTDAGPEPTRAGTSGGYPTYNEVALPQHVAVDGFGTVYPLTCAGAVAFGAKVKAAANGQVVEWDSAADGVELIVGQCVETGGVASGAKGLIRITV